MSAITRFGPAMARSVVMQNHTRHMASASGSDPIQRLFLDKIRDYKTSNKGLDETHKKMLDEEILRLKRVYNVADENKLSHMDHKFDAEHNVALYDIDSTKELRQRIQSGEYQKQLVSQAAVKSELLESIPEQVKHSEFDLPPLNKPDKEGLLAKLGSPSPIKIAESKADYEYNGPTKVTPDYIERCLNVKFSDTMPTIHDDKAPERDVVNFPRQPPPLDAPPTRHHIIPESWFQFFYPKTGVTGPYLFAGSLFTFLMSKEWLVLEHELVTAFSSAIIFAYFIPKYGPKVSQFMRKQQDEIIGGWDEWQQGNARALGQLIDSYKRSLASGNVIEEVYDARRQEVELQLEAEYRNRLKKVYEDTKRRLNYLVAVADSQRQINHHHMVSSVISNVHSSFGPKQESEVLDNCIANLKQLANKNANVI